MRPYLFFAGLLFYISLSACQRRNCAEHVSQGPPAAAEQKQLWDQLVSGSVQHATYEVLQYNDSAGRISLDVLVYGENLCGVLRLDVLQDDASLNALLLKKGGGYRGAVLEKPFIRTETTPQGTRYILSRVARIRD